MLERRKHPSEMPTRPGCGRRRLRVEPQTSAAARWYVGLVDSEDILTRVNIRGLRCLQDVTLDLRGLTVLCGENGGGKSSILEGLEVMRRLASPSFLNELNSIHGGVRDLLGAGASSLELACALEDPSGKNGPLEYSIELALDSDRTSIRSEFISIVEPSGKRNRNALSRANGSSQIEGVAGPVPLIPEGVPAIATFGLLPPHPAMARVARALARIDVHPPFEVTPAWVGRAHQRSRVARDSSVVAPADRLSRLGENLVNAFSALKNDFGEEHWRETLDYVRLGLSDRVETVSLRHDPGGGRAALWLKMAGSDQWVPSWSLSDGMMAYLMFVALFRLEPGRSLLGFDEPELHLHPGLLLRVLGFFETISSRHPVLLATHSDRLLDALSDPVGSIRVCELDAAGRTQVRKLDRTGLERWMKRYRGFGDLRGEGYADEVIVREVG